MLLRFQWLAPGLAGQEKEMIELLIFLLKALDFLQEYDCMCKLDDS